MLNDPERIRDLEQRPIGPLLFSYALPAVVGSVVNALYNVVDRMFIGLGVGDAALAGVAVTFPIFFLLTAFGMLVGIGASVQVSILLGRKDFHGAEKLLVNAVSLTFLFNLVVCTLTFIFMRPLLEMFGASEQIMPYAIRYLRIQIPINILADLAFSYTAIMRASGYPKKAMYAMLIGAILNMTLDPIFIFVFDWSIEGAAWSTAISMLVTAVYVMGHFFNPKHTLHFDRSAMQLDIRQMVRIVRIGIAPFAMMLVGGLVAIVINRSFMQYAETTWQAENAIAAYGIILGLSQLFIQFMVGVSMGMQPIVGYNLGAGNIHRSIATYKAAVLVNVIVAVVGFVIAIFAPQVLVRAFTSEGPLADATASAMAIVFLAYPIVGLQVTTVQFLQSIGHSMQAMFLSLTRQLIYLLPCLLIVPAAIGMKGVWVAMPIADLLAGLTALAMILYMLPRIRKKYATQTSV